MLRVPLFGYLSGFSLTETDKNYNRQADLIVAKLSNAVFIAQAGKAAVAVDTDQAESDCASEISS